MQFTEEMVSYTANEVLGTQKITFKDQDIDLTPPWKRVELRQGIIDACGIDIDEHPEADTLFKAMSEKGMTPKPDSTRGKLIDALIGDFLEPNFIQPTFLYDYPRDISPLAKNKPENPAIVERFEGFIGGMELCNAFTELNDPLEQEKRFLEMGRAYEDNDEERHPMDEDYLQAMSYGMPPNGGFGMGIDRLVMLFTNMTSIREVILFPICVNGKTSSLESIFTAHLPQSERSLLFQNEINGIHDLLRNDRGGCGGIFKIKVDIITVHIRGQSFCSAHINQQAAILLDIIPQFCHIFRQFR